MDHPKKHKDNLVWIDMEMTGLDPEKERVIEIATIVTDKNLEIIENGPDLVIHQPKRFLDTMDPWNQKQHGKSGLLEEVQKTKMTVKKAEQLTLEFIKKYCVPHKTSLCGNAVYHDRRFIIKYMPKLNEFLHYRLVDVSTIKGLIQRWYPRAQKTIPKKSETHRALADIKESIEELDYYRRHFFK